MFFVSNSLLTVVPTCDNWAIDILSQKNEESWRDIVASVIIRRPWGHRFESYFNNKETNMLMKISALVRGKELEPRRS